MKTSNRKDRADAASNLARVSLANGQASQVERATALEQAIATEVNNWDFLRARCLYQATGNACTTAAWLQTLEPGDFAENLAFFQLAVRQAEQCAAELLRLRDHIMKSGETRSVAYLLPQIDLVLSHFQRNGLTQNT